MLYKGYFCSVNLILDIGNTGVKAAVFNLKELVDFKRFDSSGWEAALQWASAHRVTRMAVSDVTGLSEAEISSRSAWDFFMIKPEVKTPLSIGYDTPETLGPDRLALAVAAWTEAGEKHPVLAFSCGTCLTYEYVIEGVYLGGAISPGLTMRLKAMHHQTGKLPALEADEFTDYLGKSTKGSMLSGAFLGMRDEINARIDAFLKEYPHGKTFITGGDGFRFARALKNPIFADNFLTLKGINQILEYQYQA